MDTNPVQARDQKIQQHSTHQAEVGVNPSALSSPSKTNVSKAKMSRTKASKTQFQFNPVLLLKFVWRHPLILVVLTWVGLIVTASVAVVDMVKLKPVEHPIAKVSLPAAPGTSSPDLSATTPITANRGTLEPSLNSSTKDLGQLPAPVAAKETLTIWSIGAIAFSCVSGSLMLSQWMKPRQPVKRLHSNPDVAGTVIRTQRLVEHPPKTIAAQPALEVQPRVPPSTEQLTTVLPADAAHPLDWDEPSLADSLDVRQRRPVSYWL